MSNVKNETVENVADETPENASVVSASALADMLGCDAKTFRRFVRSCIKGAGGTIGKDTPGRGGRYAFKASEIDVIKRRFAQYRAGGTIMLVSLDDTPQEASAE